MDIQVSDDTMWWCLKAGRGGVLEDDWIDRGIVTTGWGRDSPDFTEVSEAEFRANDDSQKQLSKFVGYDENGMSEGDVVIAYAPEKGHVSGVGIVGSAHYDENQTFRYLTEEEAEDAQVADHYYWRPVTWFDRGTPARVPDLSKRFQVNGSDQIPSPGTLNRYGTLAEKRDRIESFVEEVREAETVNTSEDGFGPNREAQIQDWVVTNIRELGLHNPRREFSTDVGRIDVLADSENGKAVIEIKRGRAGDRALGQLLGYMGARGESTGSHPQGMLIAESFTTRVRKAVSGLDDVSLHQFEVQTTVSPL